MMGIIHSQDQDQDTSVGLKDAELPEERWCQYTLQQGITFSVIGRIHVPPGMDVDDAFPPFHAANFEKADKAVLEQAILDGGMLIAESNFEPRSLLAYRLDDDPYYWFGREATLKYLGVVNFKHDA
jgi:hypothetical protein